MADLTTAWDGVTNTAIAGIARQEPPALVADDAVGRLCANLTTGEKAARLLNTAGVLGLCRLAGALPTPDAATPPPPAPPDTQPPCSAAAARLLQRALETPPLAPLLPEWIALATHHGQRVPPALLPAVLGAITKSAELRAAFLPVLGARGRWLAHLNPAWQAGAVPEGDAERQAAWETGTKAERLAALRAQRALDPAVARAWLEEVRASEPLDALTAFIEVLGVCLGLADEGLLEAFLDDKRKTVRRPAAELLARLPDTAFARRMTERARQWVTVTPEQPASLFPPRRKQPLAVTVTLPAAYDPAWARDGIEETPPQGIGVKGWWLQQLIAGTLLACWENAGQCSSAALVTAIGELDDRDTLLRGWLSATKRQRRDDWLLALLRHGAPARVQPDAAAILADMRPEARERVLLGLCAPDVTQGRAAIPALLQACDHPWSEALSRAVIGLRIDAGQYTLYENLARHLHPTCLTACRQKWQSQSGDISDWFKDRILKILDFRTEIHPAFGENP